MSIMEKWMKPNTEPAVVHHLFKAGVAAMIALLFAPAGLQNAAFLGSVVAFAVSKGSQLLGGGKPWADWFGDLCCFLIPTALVAWHTAPFEVAVLYNFAIFGWYMYLLAKGKISP